MVKYKQIFASRQLLLLFLLLINSFQTYSQESPNSISKRGGVAFRTDDNQDISKYLEYASIFNKYNQKFTFALNLGLSTVTPDYINGVKQLQASGHEMMDHTPQHRTNYFYTNLGTDYFVNHPGVYKITENKIELKHAPVDINNAKRSGYVNINGNIVTSSNGIFNDFSKFDCYLYFPSLNKLVFIDDYTGWKDKYTVEIKSFWRNEVDLGYHENIKFYNFDNDNVHLTVDALKALVEETLRLSDYYNISRPKAWIQPGGYFPRIYRNEIKTASGTLGYNSAGIFTDYSLKVFNEFNPDNDKQFGMSYGDFQDQSWTLDQLKTYIADRIAKHQVVFGESHFTDFLGGWTGFLDRTEKLIQWCLQNSIPIRTYSEWANVLYNQTPNPEENIIPPLNADLDGNNFPDGYNKTVEGNLLKSDGYPSANDFCYSISKTGLMSSIKSLGGVEKGQNVFEVWTKGASGNYIEVTIKAGTQNLVYKFPAENSEWTKYTLAQSINGNTSLYIPNDVSLIDIAINCSNYVSGEVKISGMWMAKSSGSSEYLSVTPSNKSVPNTIGSTNFSILSNVSWTASTDASWLIISPSSGSNDAIINASYSENTSTNQRVGTITLAGGGVTKLVTVTQSSIQMVLTLTPSDRTISNIEGNTTFTVTSNTNWTVSDNVSWLTLSPISGLNDGTITATYTGNPNISQRIGTITITGGGLIRSATVTQESTPSMTVEPPNQFVGYSSGSTTFSITTNRSWTASDDADWLTVSPTSGPNDETLTVTYLSNPNTFQREGTITVYCGGITSKVTVTQAAKPFSLVVTPSDQGVPYTTGSTEFTVSSNTEWTASNIASWLTITPGTGSNDGTITATYAENPNVSQRVGKITVIGGGITRTVTVTQESKPFLSIEPMDQEVGYISGGTTISINTNRSWTASEDENWITISPTNGTASGLVNITYLENPNVTKRTGEITINVEGISRTVTITQGSTPAMSVEPIEQFVGFAAGNFTFSITTNRNWTASDDADWVSISPTEGPNDETVTVTYQENLDTIKRIGTISIYSGGIIKNVTVNQESAPSLSVEPSDFFVGNTEGSITAKITTNRNWLVTDDSDWLTVTPTSGSTDGILSLTYSENTSDIRRAGIITITGGGLTKTVIITQESSPTLEVSPSEQYISNTEGTSIIVITSNRDWLVEDDADWLTITPTSGSNDSMLLVSCTENFTTTQRVATITLTGGGLSRKVILTQNSTPLLEINPSDQFVGNGEGTTSLKITSNRDWLVEDDADWLTITPTSGSNDTTLVVLYSENNNWVHRIGTVTINGGGLTRKITIAQASAPLLEVSPVYLSVGNTEGSTELTITSNKDWVVEKDAEWISISPIIGSNDGTLRLTYTQNLDTVQRIATIKVTGGELSRNIALKQEAKEYLTISTSQITLPADSGITKVIIDSNIDWLIQKDVDWLKLNKYSGFLKDTVDIQYCNNKRHKIRSGKILINGRGISKEIFVTQNAAGAYLIIKTEVSQLDPDSGKISVEVLSNTEWKIHSGVEWISADSDSGVENESITLSYSYNQDSLSRIGTVILYGDSVSSLIVLEQKGLDVFNILAETDSSISGTTLGSGRYLFGTEAKIVAIPKTGWKFKSWTEDTSIISTDSVYVFNVTASRTLVAGFYKVLTGIENENIMADQFELYQNYPNPFNPVTKIRYSIPSNPKSRSTKVVLTVIDILGNEIAILTDEEQDRGYYEVEWHGEKLSSGIYIYRLRAGDFISTKKMLLVK